MYVVTDTADADAIFDIQPPELEEAPEAVESVPEAVVPTVVIQQESVAKSEDDTPWYKTPAFIGGILSVLAFTAIAFFQSRAEAKVK